MPNRPTIPSEVQREVLIEAGHRCAVCGAESPLEFAHIDAWSRSKDHSARNIICLCASCHQRADTDKKRWGAKTLRRYKEKPWIRTARLAHVSEIPPGSAEPLRPLHQIPPPPGDFTGREAELAELRKAVEAGGATISGVRGMGGVGKTVLALKLAEELSPLYPDAQIYLDLKGLKEKGQEPLTPAQALAHVIRAFHPEARLPESEAELAGLYQSVLHGRRVLLLMDNAADAAQVGPLSPPAGCLLLVTSRFHFTLPGLVVKNLDELPHSDACALLLKLAPRIDGAAGKIARICDGLPFALRLAGSALAERPDLSPASYLRRLADEKERLGLVEGTLKLSFQLLPEDLKSLWCKLAVFPAPFDAAAAADIWGMEGDSALDVLGTLLKSSLVEGEDGRYRLHDLARLFADSQLGEAERRESQTRHAEHYLRVIAAADDLYEKGREALLDGLRLFDSEWTNFQAGQLWASSNSEQESRAAGLCRDYSAAAFHCLDLRLPARVRIVWLQAACNATRKLSDRSGEGKALGHLGLAFGTLGRFRDSIECHEQHLAIAREVGDRLGEGNALGNLGLAHAGLGKPRDAIAFHEQHLAIAQEIGDRRGEGNAMGNLGSAYAALGEPRRAIKFFQKDLAIAQEIGDRRGEGNALGNLGVAYAALGKPRHAIDLHNRRSIIAREIGDRRGEGNALGNLADAYTDLGETDHAIELHTQRLVIAREIGHRRGEAISSWNLGWIYEQQGDLHRAAELMQVCVDYERELGHPDAEAHDSRVQRIRARLGKRKHL